MQTREQLDAWVLTLAHEAMARDPIAAEEMIRALTGGYDAFCPQGHSRDRLHKAAAAFLMLARLQ